MGSRGGGGGRSALRGLRRRYQQHRYRGRAERGGLKARQSLRWVFFKDHGQPLFDEPVGSEAARESGRSRSLAGKEFDCLDETPGVRTRPFGFGPYDPDVAGALLGPPHLSARPVEERVPPERRARRELEQAYPVIAALDVRELVQEQRITLVDGQLVGEPLGEQDHRSSAPEPEQRRDPC